ncbi:AAA family ATPase, partial [Paenibacillus filicis]
MRIERIDIGAFGPLRDTSLRLDGPVTLLYGPNEAGKSSVLEFIRAVLFGFQTRSGAGRYAPDPAVIQGGTLTLVTGEGDRIRVERWDRSAERKGRAAASGYVKVRFPDGTMGGERELSELVGGMTPDVFQHVFAFGLSELQELGTLQNEEVSGFLYSAGLGISGSAIRTAQRKLTQEMEQLYRPRGRTPLVNLALQRLADAEERLRASRRQSGKYEALLQEERQASERCGELEEELGELQRRSGELERLRQAGPHAVRYAAAGDELEGLPDGLEQVPEDALAREEALESDRERIAAEQDRLVLQRQEQETALAGLEADREDRERLLSDQPETAALLERLAGYEETLRQRAEALGEADQQDAELERLLRRISPEWTTATLDRLPSTVLLKEQAAEFREDWRSWKQEQALLDTEHLRISREAALEGTDDPSPGEPGRIEAALERLTAARRLLAEWREAQRELRYAGQRLHDLERIAGAGTGTGQAGQTAQETASDGRAVLVGLLAAAVVIPGVLFLMKEPVAAAVAFVLLGALGLVRALGRLRKRGQAQRSAAGRGGRMRQPGDGGQMDVAASLGPLQAHAAELEARLSAELSALERLGWAYGPAESAAAREEAADGGEPPAARWAAPPASEPEAYGAAGLRPRSTASGRKATAAPDGSRTVRAAAAGASAPPRQHEDIEP